MEKQKKKKKRKKRTRLRGMNIFAIFKMVFIPTRLSLLEGSRKITSGIRLSPNSTSNNLKESCEFLSNGELHSQDLYMLLKGKKKKTIILL